MRKFIGLSAVVLAGVCFIATYALSQDKADPAKDKAMGGMDAAMMQAWEEASKPGPHHKGLKQWRASSSTPTSSRWIPPRSG